MMLANNWYIECCKLDAVSQKLETAQKHGILGQQCPGEKNYTEITASHFILTKIIIRTISGIYVLKHIFLLKMMTAY